MFLVGLSGYKKYMFRKFAIIITLFAVIGIVVPQVTPLGVSTAYAQAKTKKKRKNLLQLLFGGSLRKKRKKYATKKFSSKRVKVSKKRKTRKTRKTRKASNSRTTTNRKTRKTAGSVKKSTSRKAIVTAGTTAKKIINKNVDAAKVIVVGDFMANGMSYGLSQVFSQNPAIEFLDKTRGLSGIVRNDVADWPNKIAELIDKNKPVLVIMQLGMNDRQSMRLKTGQLKKLTPEWKKNYEGRIDALIKNVRSKRIPLVWVGLPPVSKNSMNRDYLAFNEIYQNKVEALGGTYVDIWDGFTNIDGRYIRSGPNIDGRIVKLRASDGINMTRSGQIKMAFYAEKSVRRLTGIGRESLFSSVTTLSSDKRQFSSTYDPIASGKTVVIALGGPAADGGSVLEGADGFITATDAQKSSSFELVSFGKSSEASDGRIDSGWGRSSFDIGTTETPEPVLANIRGISFQSYLDDPLQTPVNRDALKTGVDDGGLLGDGVPVVALPTINNALENKSVKKPSVKRAPVKKKKSKVVKKKVVKKRAKFNWADFWKKRREQRQKNLKKRQG